MKGEANKQSSEQTTAKNTPSKDEGHQKSPKKHEDREKHIQKAPTTLEKKEKGEKEEETKKHKTKEKPLTDGQSQRMWQLLKAAAQKGHISDAELPTVQIQKKIIRLMNAKRSIMTTTR